MPDITTNYARTIELLRRIDTHYHSNPNSEWPRDLWQAIGDVLTTDSEIRQEAFAADESKPPIQIVAEVVKPQTWLSSPCYSTPLFYDGKRLWELGYEGKLTVFDPNFLTDWQNGDAALFVLHKGEIVRVLPSQAALDIYRAAQAKLKAPTNNPD